MTGLPLGETLPPIAIGADDYYRLSLLAEISSVSLPALSSFLSRELARAELVVPWSGLVGMGSVVHYREDGRSEMVSGRLVYPSRVAGCAGSIPILSETGVALLGLREGQTIRWRSEAGGLRSLTVLRVG